MHLLLDFLDGDGWQLPNSGGSAAPLKATFFVLGWVAERFHGLVREIQARGHEVSSHGYQHDLCDRSSVEDFRKDVLESKKILEDIVGEAVVGYRAPSFSINEESLEILEQCGYLYDSSFNSFSGNGRHGKIRLYRTGEGIVCKTLRNVYELPISNLEVGGYAVPAGGGAYFRLTPVRVFEKIVQSVLRRGNAYLFYVHPWEADPEQPRVKGVSMFARFRHYTNLAKTLPRLRFLASRLKDVSFVSCSQYLQEMTMH
jgi:polysaccharide deacetylase family protein (PEP-CTERM system associated)